MRAWDQYAYSMLQDGMKITLDISDANALFLCPPWFHTNTDLHLTSGAEEASSSSSSWSSYLFVPGIEITSLPTCHTLNAREERTVLKTMLQTVHLFKSEEAENNICLRWHVITSSEIKTTFRVFICWFQTLSRCKSLRHPELHQTIVWLN